ncbi:retrovirus-related pol polyprotein from transposon TNT 1-94, partial [Tanacetum coccineum]
SKDEAPDFIIKFLKMIQVWLKAPVRRIRTDNGTEFVNQTLRQYYEKVVISLETSVARSPQQNGVVERCNQAIATPCYTQNRSIIRLRHGKIPYELLHDKLPDISFFHEFGALCYPTNDSDNLDKLQPKADIGIFIGYAPTKKAFRIYNRRSRRSIETIHVDFDELTTMASEHSSLKPVLYEMTPATINSGLVPNPPPSIPFVPPSRTEWDILFQPLFDELLNPPSSVDRPAPEVIAPIAEVVALEPAASTGSHSSTTVEQDAPSPTSSSSDVIPTIMQTATPYSEHVTKWTKDHPLDNIIGELKRLVSTRLQLYEQALFCYYDVFLTSVEPKNYKDALTQACWIKAITPVSTTGPSFDTAVPSTPVNTAGPSVSTTNESKEQLFERFSPFKNAFTLPPVPNISLMDNTGIFRNAYDNEDVEEEVDMNNVISSYTVLDTSFTKFHKDHPEDQVIGSLKTSVQTRHMTKINEEHGLISSIHKLRRTNHKDFQNCLFACFLSQMEPKQQVQALKDPSWVEAMQDELLQFKLLKVWTLVDLPRDKWAIEEEVSWFEDPHFPDKVYKVEKALHGLHQAPRAWYETLSTYLLENDFHRGQIDKTLFIKRDKDDILLV